jgi:N-acetylmuramoyl-L-alanine amidase
LTLVALLLALSGGRAVAIAAEVPQITGLRFGLQQWGRTRVVLDSDRKLAFNARAVADPWRLVIDLPEVVWNPQPGPLSQERGLARSHRFDAIAPNRSQLVVDTGTPIRVQNAMLLPPSEASPYHRLVVDLVPTTAPPPERSAPPTVEAAVEAPEPARPPAPPPAPRAEPMPGVPDAAAEAPRLADLPPAAVNGHVVAPALPKPEPAPPPAADGDTRPVIVLDAGHGGLDPGAIGVNGVYEKTLTLAMARQLREVIGASGRYRTFMTRDKDVFVPLRQRIQRAREANGSLFISLHADVLAQERTRGASVYTLSETASDEEAALLASKENKADIIAGADLSNHDAIVASILIDLAQRDTNNRSIEFADTLTGQLAEVTPLLRKHRRFAGFAVLKSPDMPSVLIELGYISNQEDTANLSDPGYRDKLARAVLEALDRYFAVIRS